MPSSFGPASSTSAKMVLFATLAAGLGYEPPRMLAPLRDPLLAFGSSAGPLFDLPIVYTLELRRVVGDQLAWANPVESCSATRPRAASP